MRWAAFRIDSLLQDGMHTDLNMERAQIMKCSWGSAPMWRGAIVAGTFFEAFILRNTSKRVLHRTFISAGRRSVSVEKPDLQTPLSNTEDDESLSTAEGGRTSVWASVWPMINRVKVKGGDTFGSVDLNAEHELFPSDPPQRHTTSNEGRTGVQVQAVR